MYIGSFLCCKIAFDESGVEDLHAMTFHCEYCELQFMSVKQHKLLHICIFTFYHYAAAFTSFTTCVYVFITSYYAYTCITLFIHLQILSTQTYIIF